jgi:hypothetical protein
MTRWLFLIHRYLGIGIGVLMVMWCLSGVVMMYVSYPTLDPHERVGHLAPIDWSQCCRLPPSEVSDVRTVGAFSLEMLAGHPMLSLGVGRGAGALLDLATGAHVNGISLAQATSVAATYATPGLSPRLMSLLDYDQWTFEGVAPADRPLYHFDLADPRHSELYVSSSTGRAVQLTTRTQRFWNWAGAVPHWLYFAGLRHRTRLWSQVVIYTSLLGCFLTVIGLYIGARQFIHRPAGRWSPYRGLHLWHHTAGLLFGIFTLTWVLSGLLSMNPWGLLEGGGAREEGVRLRGPALPSSQLETALQALAVARPSVVALQSAPLRGKLYLMADGLGGERRRLDGAGAISPLDDAQRTFIAASLSRGATAASLQLLISGDNYYFSHHSDPLRFPVYRLLSMDGSGTRYYVDPLSGQLLGKIDNSERGYRWWHAALHRMDFAALVRGRPQWDALMWLLLSGVTTVCVSGTYMGYRRLMRAGFARRHTQT